MSKRFLLSLCAFLGMAYSMQISCMLVTQGAGAKKANSTTTLANLNSTGDVINTFVDVTTGVLSNLINNPQSQQQLVKGAINLLPPGYQKAATSAVQTFNNIQGMLLYGALKVSDDLHHGTSDSGISLPPELKTMLKGLSEKYQQVANLNENNYFYLQNYPEKSNNALTGNSNNQDTTSILDELKENKDQLAHVVDSFNKTATVVDENTKRIRDQLTLLQNQLGLVEELSKMQKKSMDLANESITLIFKNIDIINARYDTGVELTAQTLNNQNKAILELIDQVRSERDTQYATLKTEADKIPNLQIQINNVNTKCNDDIATLQQTVDQLKNHLHYAIITASSIGTAWVVSKVYGVYKQRQSDNDKDDDDDEDQDDADPQKNKKPVQKKTPKKTRTSN